MKRILVGLFLSLVIVMPLFAEAGDTSWTNGFVPCGLEDNANAAATSCDLDDLVLMGQRIVNFLFFAAVLLTVCLLVYVGYLYITAASNPAQLGEVKSKFRTIIVGFVLILSAWLIINALVTLLLDPESGITNPPSQEGEEMQVNTQ